MTGNQSVLYAQSKLTRPSTIIIGAMALTRNPTPTCYVLSYQNAGAHTQVLTDIAS